MKRYITIDGGTSTTRVSLLENKTLIATQKPPVSVGKCKHDKPALVRGIKDAINDLLTKHKLLESDVCAILASGMITSEYGLCELSHLPAPAGIAELHDAMNSVFIPEISNIPFFFLRGVRLISNSVDDCDMMRGEETELMGLMSETDGACVYVLPGSHSKIIRTDKNGRIVDFRTMLTGEMIAALSQNTVLRDAVDLSSETYDKQALLDGYRYAAAHGINEALFKVRVLKVLFSKNAIQTYSFFLGVILCDEIDYILSSKASKVVIGGRQQIKDATAEILRTVSDAEIVTVSEELVAASTSLGMIRIFEYKK